eukprot:8091239-Pyramimonas_sp.AAC.1
MVRLQRYFEVHLSDIREIFRYYSFVGEVTIYCLPSCDWFSRCVCTASPPGLVLMLGIYCLPSWDWFSRWAPLARRTAAEV